MKTLTLLFVGVCVALLGVGGASAQGTTPNVTGVWTGTCSHVGDEGYIFNVLGRLRVTDQNGGIFRGTLIFPTYTKTNWLSGCIQPSLMAPGAFDVGLSVASDDGEFFLGTALLKTNVTPWVIQRLQLQQNNGDSEGSHAYGTITGSFKKK